MIANLVLGKLLTSHRVCRPAPPSLVPGLFFGADVGGGGVGAGAGCGTGAGVRTAGGFDGVGGVGLGGIKYNGAKPSIGIRPRIVHDAVHG